MSNVTDSALAGGVLIAGEVRFTRAGVLLDEFSARLQVGISAAIRFLSHLAFLLVGPSTLQVILFAALLGKAHADLVLNHVGTITPPNNNGLFGQSIDVLDDDPITPASNQFTVAVGGRAFGPGTYSVTLPAATNSGFGFAIENPLDPYSGPTNQGRSVPNPSLFGESVALVLADGSFASEFGPHEAITFVGDRGAANSRGVVTPYRDSINSNASSIPELFAGQHAGSFLFGTSVAATRSPDFNPVTFNDAVLQVAVAQRLGAPSTSAADFGSVHFFESFDNGRTWTLTQEFVPDGFGSDSGGRVIEVDMSGNRAIVGLGDSDDGGDAFILEKSNGVWSIANPLGLDTVIDGQDSNDLFSDVAGYPGAQVAIHNDRAIVGSSASDAAYVFRDNGNQNWTLEAELTLPSCSELSLNPGCETNAKFGLDVDIHGDLAAVRSQAGGTSVSIFSRSSGIWSHLETVTINDSTFAGGSINMESLALSDHALFVGLPRASGNVGRVEVYSIQAIPEPSAVVYLGLIACCLGGVAYRRRHRYRWQESLS